MPRFVRAALAERTKRYPDAPTSAADQFRREYGRALADEIALPLVEAWSGAPATELSPAVAEKIPGGIAETIGLKVAARLTHRAVAIGYCNEAPQSANVWHVYPEHGITTVCESLAADVADSVRLQQPGRAHHRERGPRRRCAGRRASRFRRRRSSAPRRSTCCRGSSTGTDALEPVPRVPVPADGLRQPAAPRPRACSPTR